MHEPFDYDYLVAKEAATDFFTKYESSITLILGDLERINPQKIEYVPQSKLDAVYRERNLVAAALARLAIAQGWKAGIGNDPSVEEGWQNVLFIDLPTGQVSWHIHSSEIEAFSSLQWYENAWDGHTVMEKNARLFEFVNNG